MHPSVNIYLWETLCCQIMRNTNSHPQIQGTVITITHNDDSRSSTTFVCSHFLAQSIAVLEKEQWNTVTKAFNKCINPNLNS